MEVRFGLVDGVRALEELQLRASLVWEEYRDDLLANPDAIALAEELFHQQCVRIAVVEDRMVGFIVIVPQDEANAEVDGLFVEPDQMRRGIGRHLLQDAEEMWRGQGVKRFEVTANPRALEFYEKLGFVADGVVATRFGDGIRMHQDFAQ